MLKLIPTLIAIAIIGVAYLLRRLGLDEPIRDWAQRWRGVIRVYFYVFVTAGFMMFIMEEASQVRGFSRYGFHQGRMWVDAKTAAEEDVVWNKTDKFLTNIGSVINPIAGYVFKRYFASEEVKLQREIKRVDKELGLLKARVTIIESNLKSEQVAAKLPSVSSQKEKPTRFQSLPVSELPRASKQIDYRPNPQPQNVGSDSSVELVYATMFGECYHRSVCGSLAGKQVREFTKPQAVEAELRACRRCRP